ncbi:hypothetical protein A9Q84_08095 [Halobacteriovorax marinus]|uniref:YkuD domain-containing protein n=1 Tax=Halobacteriovorax marinus TaxID=97084 RepID=A0A1Y5FBG0_9BACT|nr:hypothetical protein A9Q84_08095 [Halobacteriovorax marinus]
MVRIQLITFIVATLFLISCEDKKLQNSIGENISSDHSGVINKATNNLSTIPSTYEVTDHIERQVSAPKTKNCKVIEEIEEEEEEEEEEIVETSSGNELCDYPELGNSWVSNCEKLFTNSNIPKDALEYTMKAFKNNFDKFRNKNCYLYKGGSSHYSLKGLSRSKFEDAMKDGIPNKCQIVINNTKEKLSTFRGKMYYIDICKGKVTESYFNMGSGTFKSKYANVNGKNSTVKGIFLTGTGDFDFKPGGSKSKVKYKKIRQYMKKTYGESKAHAVQLIGLQSTNSGSGPDSKYMHISPYRSSWGCPSIDKDNYWMIKELAKNGPSMVVNYGTGMQDIEEVNKCGSRKK